MPDQKGFTLIELLLVIGLFGVLAGIITINLIRPQLSAAVSTTTQILSADLRAQQLKAMAGNTDGKSTAQSQGIYFETNSYTLFSGTSYNASDSTNFGVPLSDGTTISNINLPSNQVVFNKGNGEVQNFNASQNTITITHSGGVNSTITVNKYGIPNID